MKERFSFYVGVDWGVEFHQARILDAKGEKICQRRIEHSGPGMLEFYRDARNFDAALKFQSAYSSRSSAEWRCWRSLPR